ncbi:MJ1255/VC2487 family glycosyltransferase [Thalassotalea marina]|uniref:Glycosyl transferase n=1 Tax=Thalassotalea marina TaxID=1673741 RepID=A0A919EN45_9GAMM|nr:MJ1255/VC2487 family glycosyltransferase [Thalassotalea marina]GHF97853.1 glycosyl transferase [Thalassotalea marina]
MKILYGIQATGNGHISRSRVMAKYLKQHKVDVTYLFSGREQEKLFDMEIFGDYLYRRGLTFSTSAGQMNYVKTLFTNNVFGFIRDIYSLDVSEYDLVITDFEPITAWAAKRQGVKSLAIGHQYAFGPNTPVAGETYIARKIMQHFAPAEQSFGLHWSKFDENVLPPIIDVELEKTENNGPILVYLPFEDQHYVTEVLNEFPEFHFVQYSQELDNSQLGNVDLRKTCYEGFKADLKRASGVICNSGFELNSECIHLGIPILTKPISGQMEQESNALALKQLGLGEIMSDIEPNRIEHWLKHLPTQPRRKTPDVAKEIVNWLVNEPKASAGEFSQKLWRSS